MYTHFVSNGDGNNKKVELEWLEIKHSYHCSYHRYIHGRGKPDLTMSMYKWSRVSCSGVADIHLATCVCTSSSVKELIRPVCSLMHSINSFHNRLMLHHLVISQEVSDPGTRLTFQFLVFFLWKWDIHLFFLLIFWKNAISIFRQKSIDMAVVAEQTTVAFDWKLCIFPLCKMPCV